MVIFTKEIVSELQTCIKTKSYDRIFMLCDENTKRYCLPVFNSLIQMFDIQIITINADDVNKDINQVIYIWDALTRGNASRNSLLINLGGGMITDIGGFAGATFKRGLHTLNIPTTLMASVDAAIGGKTGFNFNGLKNEIGCFYQPDHVIIDCCFLASLDHANFLSGYAEMLKHSLINDVSTYHQILTYDVTKPDFSNFNEMIYNSVSIKQRIVDEDPKENGIRKALNLGHTIGHAFESLSFSKKKPVLHGHAIAAGLICELYISHKHCGLPINIVRQVTNFVHENYIPAVSIDCNEYKTIKTFMVHDKKNENGNILFTLLEDIGKIHINQQIDDNLIDESLDFYREI